MGLLIEELKRREATARAHAATLMIATEMGVAFVHPR
jgi:hypothetical protein